MPLRRALVLLGIVVLSGCHTAPHVVEGPVWTRLPSRTMDAGYIVYVGVGEDSQLERARFKAESEAIADLANECSFVPKGARIEDHFDEPDRDSHRAYAKLGVTFEECETAKRAVEPAQIQALASTAMMEELKRYQELMREPEPGTPAELAAASAPTEEPGAWIHDSNELFMARQRVAFVKEQIILAPSAAPAVSLAPATARIQHYEQTNPEVRTWSSTWSRSTARASLGGRMRPAFSPAPSSHTAPMRPRYPSHFRPHRHRRW